ncbi:hypothetical protein [Shewanella marina]|uniref:hypothetical protein n=1 Tax=Shewanella marina TaxID=487319 RepID=UPI000471AA84|nr:hypothetical protein [Shewanella marina]
MRVTLILSLCLLFSSSTSYAVEALTKAQAEELFQQQQFDKLIDAININMTADVYRFKLLSLVSKEQEDEAEQAYQAYINKHTTNAKAYVIGGQMYGKIASQASIFSALGYAEDSLAQFEKAYQLAPKNPKIASGLFQFYNNAPDIAGGDSDKALQLAHEIIALDEDIGQQALLSYYAAEEMDAEFKQQLQLVHKLSPNDPNINLIAARYADDDHKQALQALLPALKYQVETPEQQQALQNVRYQIAKHTVKGELDYAQAIAVLTDYMQAPLPKHADWAELRMAQLLYAQGEYAAAKPWAQKALDSEEKRVNKPAKKLLKKINKKLK